MKKTKDNELSVRYFERRTLSPSRKLTTMPPASRSARQKNSARGLHVVREANNK